MTLPNHPPPQDLEARPNIPNALSPNPNPGPAEAKPDTKVSYASLHNKRQLSILCLARLVEPVAATSIQVCTLVPPPHSTPRDTNYL